MIDIHKHCPICNTPIPLNEKTCSQKCQKSLEAKQAQMKRSRLILYIVMIIFIAVFIYIMIFNK